jgi:beta-glucosidase-like glycosyl hydrolase
MRPRVTHPAPHAATPAECLHGYWELDENSTAPPTIFPQPLGMAATFDRDLVAKV